MLVSLAYRFEDKALLAFLIILKLFSGIEPNPVVCWTFYNPPCAYISFNELPLYW